MERYQIPVFLFINKMDQAGTDKDKLIKELKKRLNENCVDFSSSDIDGFNESIAICNEYVLEDFLEKGTIETEQISQMIKRRELFPCYFGSALR